ncbi:MAG: VWA domain-containing protein [Thermoguttaceae bacterium]
MGTFLTSIQPGLILFQGGGFGLLFLRFGGRTPKGRRSLYYSIAVCVLLLGLIIGPQFQIGRLVSPRLFVLLDDSRSMTQLERPRKTDTLSKGTLDLTRQIENSEVVQSSLHQAERILKTFSVLSPSYQIQSRRLSEITDSKLSPLGTAVLNLLAEKESPDVIVLLSDGQLNQGLSLETVARILAEKKVPLYTVGLGEQQERPTLRWKDPDIPLSVSPGEMIRVRSILETLGLPVLTPISIRLEKTQDQEGEERTVLYEETLETVGEQTRISIPLSEDKPGLYVFRLIAQTPNWEEDWTDNVLEFAIRVRTEPKRILLIDRTPRYEYRFLREWLRQENAWKLQTVLEDADPEYVVQDPLALSYDDLTPDLLRQCDLIILGDVNPNQLDWNAIITDNQLSCSLLCIPGKRARMSDFINSPLGPFLPIGPDSMRIQQNDVNQQSTFGQQYQQSERDNQRQQLDWDHLKRQSTIDSQNQQSKVSDSNKWDRPEINLCLTPEMLSQSTESTFLPSIRLEPLSWFCSGLLRPGAKVLARTETGIPILVLRQKDDHFCAWLGTDEIWRSQTPVNDNYVEQLFEDDPDQTCNHAPDVPYESSYSFFWRHLMTRLTEWAEDREGTKPARGFEDGELARTRRNSPLLDQAATISAGAHFEEEDVGQLLVALQKREKESHKREMIPLFPPFPTFIVILVFLLLLWKENRQ